MTNKFTQYITKHEIVRAKQHNRMASFCHFDANNRIADYVLHYVKALTESGADIFFVSNCPQIAEEELAKIRPFVTQIILRQNVGYDFACYFTGYVYGRKHGYAEVVFANDSCFGPFYPLAELFEKMSGFDMWGISDAYAGRYHIQSNFWVFNNMRAFLDKEAEDFEFINIKEQVVGRYEEGISQKLIAGKFRMGVLCDNKKMVEFEAKSDDPVLLKLKSNIRQIAVQKINVTRKIKGALLPHIKRRNNAKIEAHANFTGIFSCWYAAVKYFNCPFIKVSLLKRPQMQKYHDGEYIELLRSKYPSYDWQMIERHLGKQ